MLPTKGDARSRMQVDTAQFRALPVFWAVEHWNAAKGVDPEVGKRSDKRATPPSVCAASSATPSVPRFSVTHPPLGERKSVSSSSPAPNIALAFAPLLGGSRSVSKAFSRQRREMPRQRAAFRQDELSHGCWAKRRHYTLEEVGQRQMGGPRGTRAAWRKASPACRGGEIRGSSEVPRRDWLTRQRAGQGRESAASVTVVDTSSRAEVEGASEVSWRGDGLSFWKGDTGCGSRSGKVRPPPSLNPGASTVLFPPGQGPSTQLLSSAKGERARDWQSGDLSFRHGPYSDIAGVTLRQDVGYLSIPVCKTGSTPLPLDPCDLCRHSLNGLFVQCFCVPIGQEAFRPRRSSNTIPFS